MYNNILVIGATGQDGSNMVDYLLEKTDYNIYGAVRRISMPNYVNLQQALKHPRFQLFSVDLADSISVKEAVRKLRPDYLINLAANSFVAASWDMPLQVMDVNALGVIRCLEAIKEYAPNCHFYSAGSSEEMGNILYSPQDISHPIRPRSIYGVSKAAARHAVKVYRESYGLYAVHGILYNHEGPRRGEEFVTRKITMGVARIKTALERGETYKPIELGNLNARRDWSDSSDFVDGIWKMLNQPTQTPKEYILASGKMHSIREFVEEAFKFANIVGSWGVLDAKDPTSEVFFYASNEFDRQNPIRIPLVRVNPKFYRPADVEELCGDSSPIRADLGWNPIITFKELVRRMVDNDLNLIKNGVNLGN